MTTPTVQKAPTPDPPLRLAPSTLAPTQPRTLGPDTTSAWDDIRKAAPRAAARQAAVGAARSARRHLPSMKTVGLVAAVAVALVTGVLVFRPRRADLGFSRHQSVLARKEIDPYVMDLAPFAGARACDNATYEEHLERSRERVVSEETLACLLLMQQPGLIDTYLENVSIDDAELTVFDRKRRNAVSFTVGLGETVVPDLCRWVSGDSAPAQWVAASALAARGGGAAVDCLVNAAQHAANPASRAAALGGLRLMMARASIPAPVAFDTVKAATQDPDPAVQKAAIAAVAMLDFDHGDPILAAVEKDGSPEAAAAARDMRERLTRYRKLNPDLPY